MFCKTHTKSVKGMVIKMEYRLARAGDADELIPLRIQLLIDEGVQQVCDIGRELLEYFKSALSDGSLYMWLAIDGSRIIATGGLCFYRIPPSFRNTSGKVAYVTNMFTRREYRRQGVASEILRRLIDEAKSRGYTLVRLHASDEGLPLYKKFGFEESEGHMALRF